ncbi:hypothetical protein CALVIDRAFT_539095 [Calocera viscosa TUFC12733]|uniref:Uncharacterized protein n=1 Tax=Calocera viscosa (strain TUFC12733) TaxID=1330018 RepID=A0A167K7I1_CALVF|nr:hypothetical protein CALVIDRAFT_539095 [Calocera viscosa TUFC12733]
MFFRIHTQNDKDQLLLENSSRLGFGPGTRRRFGRKRPLTNAFPANNIPLPLGDVDAHEHSEASNKDVRAV